MADQRPVSTNPSSRPELSLSLGFWDKALENWKKNQTTWLTAIAVVVCVAAVVAVQTWKKRDSQESANRTLGRAMVYASNNHADSARILFQKVLTSRVGLASAKAGLFLGQIDYSAGQFDKALVSYQGAKAEGKGFPLVEGAAFRGVAASYIQLKKYAEADAELTALLSKYQKLTGDAESRAKEEEPQDLVPGLSQAMWQKVLVQEKLNRIDEASKVAARLLALYPKTPEAGQARIWLAMSGKLPTAI